MKHIGVTALPEQCSEDLDEITLVLLEGSWGKIWLDPNEAYTLRDKLNAMSEVFILDGEIARRI